MAIRNFPILFSFLLGYNVCAQNPVLYDITKYGATSGQDIAQAILNIWKSVIVSTMPSKIVIPQGNWYLGQVKIQGPNKAPVELNLQGTLKAPIDYLAMPNNQGEWITINDMNGFTITGGGVFDGRGQGAWKNNDCKKNKKCPKLPYNLSFNGINNSVIRDVTTKDSKNFHVNCIGCKNVTFVHFVVSAPGDSPNTDGIHVARSSHVTVRDSIIQTGDDCVSIGDDTQDLRVFNVTCGPGHGISVGSLGLNVMEKDVSGIYVMNCTFINTQNGVRVKTWPNGPAKLTVTKLQFKDLIMKNVSYPIDIDQQYCPDNLCKKTSSSQIKISNVSLENIQGTSWTLDAVIINCSKDKPCTNVVVDDINLQYIGGPERARSKCANAKPIVRGKQNPRVQCV